HPVQVEPVGWTSGAKDVLWGLFALIAVWQYLCFSEEPNPSKEGTTAREARGASTARDASPHRWAHYGVATAALVFGMLSKPTAVVVPFVAAVLDYFLLRR